MDFKTNLLVVEKDNDGELIVENVGASSDRLPALNLSFARRRWRLVFDCWQCLSGDAMAFYTSTICEDNMNKV